MPRLQKRYQEALGSLQKELNLKNVMKVPKIEKIVVNCGQGDAVQNIKFLEGAVRDLETITGQKAQMTKAKNSIAGFKLREGMPIGASVTLRGARMYEFLDRMVNVACPRIRDFRGFSPKAFDGNGNYSLGFKEQIVFPEIDYDKVDRIRGLGVTIVTTAENDVQGRTLMNLFNFPFRK
ncbi:MAG: 50S ribosomal protein L5 [Zetaproteobacteria bacterium]|nr:50S ribosomal protein L5 [Zetaproteobacteria bacterium]